MDIKAVEKNYQVKAFPLSVLFAKWSSRVQNYERKYGKSSQEMRDSILKGEVHENEEISEWMQSCLSLKIIKERNGRKQIGTAGTRSKTTSKSTKTA